MKRVSELTPEVLAERQEARNALLDSRGKARVQTVFEDESKTVQSDAHLADIRQILGAFGVQGIDVLEHLQLTEEDFFDVDEFDDFADVMRHVTVANEEFMKLPAFIREIFNHDPAVWLDHAHDKEKRDALVERLTETGDQVVDQPSRGAPAEPVAGAAESAGDGSGGDPGTGEAS